MPCGSAGRQFYVEGFVLKWKTIASLFSRGAEEFKRAGPRPSCGLAQKEPIKATTGRFCYESFW
jgi:hypothetical protein